MPIFAKIEVNAAKKADNSAYIIHITLYYIPQCIFVNRLV
jgi:hypothetical protein